MSEHLPHPANTPGDFYVENNCCTACEAPFSAAPELFAMSKEPHCFVKRQPKTPDELDKMITAIQWAELECIRYRGTDRVLQTRLVETGQGDVCDNLPLDLQQRSKELLEERQRQRAAKGLWAWLRRLWRMSG